MNQVQESGVIRLRAFHGKQQGHIMLCPTKDGRNGSLKGVKRYTPEQRQTLSHVVDESTQRKIGEGTELNMSDEVDATDWLWIKENREISLSIEEALSNPQCLYYVDQPDKPIENRIKKFAKKAKAMDALANLSVVEKAEVCRLLGNRVDSWRPMDIEDYLIGVVEQTPEKLMEAITDPVRKTKMFLFGLIDKNIVTKDRDGIYRFNERVLGTSEMSAVLWLEDDKNRDLVAKLYFELKGESVKAKKGASIIDELDEESDSVEKPKPVKRKAKSENKPVE